MTTIDAGLRAHLAAAGQVTAIVPPERITCGGDVPEGEPFPAITILTSSIPEVDMGGPTGLVRTEAEVDVLALDVPGESAVALAKRIATAVVGVLHCYRGRWGEHVIKGVFLEEQEDTPPDPETGLFGVSLQFIVWHRPVP